jgi:hypothetical protein
VKGARTVYLNQTPEPTADSQGRSVDDELAVLYHIGPLKFWNFDTQYENHWLCASILYLFGYKIIILDRVLADQRDYAQFSRTTFANYFLATRFRTSGKKKNHYLCLRKTKQ